jgi:hypothetical protein
MIAIYTMIIIGLPGLLAALACIVVERRKQRPRWILVPLGGLAGALVGTIWLFRAETFSLSSWGDNGKGSPVRNSFFIGSAVGLLPAVAVVGFYRGRFRRGEQ